MFSEELIEKVVKSIKESWSNEDGVIEPIDEGNIESLVKDVIKDIEYFSKPKEEFKAFLTNFRYSGGRNTEIIIATDREHVLNILESRYSRPYIISMEEVSKEIVPIRDLKVADLEKLFKYDK